MYGREELKAYDCNEGSYDSMGFPWQYKEMVYDKTKADSVMDAMERRIARLTALVEGWKKNSLVLGEMYHKRLAQEQARIKELEKENKHLEDYIDAYQKSEALDIAKLDEKDKRIKELEAEVDMDAKKRRIMIDGHNRKCERVKELEAQCTKYQAELMNNDPALNPTISKMETTTPKWVSVKDRLPPKNVEFLGCTINGGVYPCSFLFPEHAIGHLSHWMPLPPPPTTEEK